MFLFLYVSVIMFILYYIYMPHMNSFTTLGWKSVSSLGFVILGAYLFFFSSSSFISPISFAWLTIRCYR